MSFVFRHKKYELDKEVVLLKTIPLITILVLGILPFVIPTPIKIPIEFYGLYVAILALFSIIIMMVPWGKDTNIYRLKHKYVNKFLNNITTFNVYTSSFLIMLTIASIAICFLPKDDYIEKKDFKNIDYVIETNKKVNIQDIYRKKSDGMPLIKAYSYRNLSKEKYFFGYIRTKKVDMDNNIYYDYKKIILTTSKKGKELLTYNAYTNIAIGSISSQGKYQTVLIPECFFEK